MQWEIDGKAIVSEERLPEVTAKLREIPEFTWDLKAMLLNPPEPPRVTPELPKQFVGTFNGA
ncbi:hypothetical protein HY417_02895 [Candidatus Kaiserbacteria bacterium]|nr:hypothetical protein [Candidatus Kaiserbacteria bacterium]